ncbi:hypothetical protein GN956_G14173 [Arapaima gigas]
MNGHQRPLDPFPRGHTHTPGFVPLKTDENKAGTTVERESKLHRASGTLGGAGESETHLDVNGLDRHSGVY